jgi:hypothetical protein
VLGFTFHMAQTRFELRRDTVPNEANATRSPVSFTTRSRDGGARPPPYQAGGDRNDLQASVRRLRHQGCQSNLAAKLVRPDDDASFSPAPYPQKATRLQHSRLPSGNSTVLGNWCCALRSSDGAVALIRRLSWDQHLANLVALADDFKLRLPIVSANDLPPDLTGELGDEQAPK